MNDFLFHLYDRDDIAGLQNVKDTLAEAVLYPQLFPELFTSIRRPWKVSGDLVFTIFQRYNLHLYF